MNPQEISMLPHHRATVARFVAVCQEDERVVADFLGGSYARGTADAHSDLDLYLITTDHAFDHLCGAFTQIPSGPYQVLLDKQGILANAIFPSHQAEPAAQTEKLQRLVYWFWHELSHFITAMQRDQLWWAHGQLEVMRLQCVNLARLRHNFADPYVTDEYFKVELALPVAQLATVAATFCLLEKAAMLQAAAGAVASIFLNHHCVRSIRITAVIRFWPEPF